MNSEIYKVWYDEVKELSESELDLFKELFDTQKKTFKDIVRELDRAYLETQLGD